MLRIDGPWTSTRTFANGLVAVIAAVYHTMLESSRGRTLGKFVTGIVVIGPDGSRPGTSKALARNSWLLLPLLPWVGSLALGLVGFMIAVTIVSNATNAGWHDELAGTAVVRSPRLDQ